MFEKRMLKSDGGLLTFSRQSGMTVLGMVILGGLFFLWVLFIIKLVPVYIEGQSVKSIFETFEEEVKKKPKVKKEIESYFSKFFQVNNVRNVSVKDIEFENKKSVLIVTLDYSVEIPFISNVYLLVKFNNRVEAPKLTASSS